ncbi:MAG: hypothetical protein ABWW89_00425, partial [SAR116 cluster bacterium]
MNRLLSQILRRFTPRMLRSDSPNRPMVVRRRHWFLQETRFLFLTRKGPVEITVKPALILGAAFAGFVGTSVIAAATLFLGYKSVEVVTNESITPAEASAPPTIMMPSEDPSTSTQPAVPMLAMSATDTTGEVVGETDRLPEATKLAMATTPPLAPPPVAVLRHASPSPAVI